MYPDKAARRQAMKETRFDLMEEFRNGVKFNKHDLDDNLMEQPVLYERVASLLATAESDVKDTKAEIDLAEAELYLQFKDKATESDGKVTEAYVKAQVESSKRVQKLKRTLSERERRVKELVAIKESYQQRSRSMHDASNLYGDQYWQRDSGGRNDAVDRGAKRYREERKDAMRKKRQRSEDDDDE